MKIGDITSGYINNLLQVAAQLGADPKLIGTRSGLNPADLEDDDRRVDLSLLMRTGYNAIEMTGRPDLGLIAGRQAGITRLGYAGLAAMTAPDLGAALAVITRFEALFCRCYRGHSDLEVQGDTARLSFYSIAPYNGYTCFVVDAILSAWAGQINWLTGRDDLIERVTIEFPEPDYSASYQSAFSCPVRFSESRNTLEMKSADLKIPLLYQDRSLHQKLLAQCEQALGKVALANTMRNRVWQSLGQLLHGNSPTIEDVANDLQITPWTLRRKLKEEDTSFQVLVDEMRRNVALSYMRNTNLSFGEIAYLLGFSTPGAYQRAFKRWTGMTPGEFRKHKTS
jgi:AraC-like DNA-binding protein